MMIISLCSCGGYNNESTFTESSDTPTEENDSDIKITGYENIINLYRKTINICQNYIDSKDALERYCQELGITDENEKELFSKISDSAYLFYPGRGASYSSSPHYKLSCGYAIKDLNGDGVDELVLINDDYRVVAIFSMVNGTPILLGNYIPRRSCWIDGNGWLHENGSSGADYSTHAIYKIAQGGASLELIAEYGTNGHEWIDGVGVTKYYQLVNGEKIEITEDEYNSLSEQYVGYLGSNGGTAATKEDAGLTFMSLFTEEEIAIEMGLNNEPISSQEALIIAKNYWQETNGDAEEYEFVLIDKDVDRPMYIFLVRTAPYVNITEVWVDPNTGKIVPPDALG